MKFVLCKKNNSYKTNFILLYVELFIFTSICRQFHFAKMLDLRYVTLVMGILLIGMKVVTLKCGKWILKKKNVYLLVYYLLALGTNIMWLCNGINMNTEGFVKVLILFLFNICGILVFSIYKDYISLDFIWKCVVISSLILVISMFLAYFGMDMEKIWGTGLKGTNIIAENTNLTRNLLGVGIRAAGYAEDPNYATLFLLIAIISVFQIKEINRYIQVILSGIFISGMIIANSNTTMAAMFASVIIIAFMKRNRKIQRPLILAFFGFIMLMVVMLPILQPADFLMTLSSRYDMWENAAGLFVKSPVLGNGLTSFRSIHTWYVHCHSTYWEILAESGMIAFLCFIAYFYCTILDTEMMPIKYILICYSIFCLMFDMSYMQITVLIIYLLPEVGQHEKMQKSAFLY